MFASKRRLFDSERGAATSWLAGITSAALLIGTVALPAMAEGEATPEPVVTSEAVEPSEVEAQAAADAAAAEAADAAAAEAEAKAAADATAAEAEAKAAAEAEAKAAADAAAAEAEAKAAAEAEAKAAADAAAAEAEAKAAADAAAAEAEAKAAADAAAESEAVIGEPVEDVATGASSTDGDTPDINSPPVEEYVPGIKVTTDEESATIAWPEFGLDDNYAVQMEKKDGTWKTLDAEVGDASDAVRDYEATIENLKPGKEYTVRIVTAETEALAEAATEDAVDNDVSGPGLGSIARIRVSAKNSNNSNNPVVVSSAIALATPTVSAAAATPSPLPDSTFEGGDGNLAVDNASLIDWNSFTYNPATGAVTAPPGFSFSAAIDRPTNDDTIYAQGAKENDTDPDTQNSNNVTSKSDLLRAYVASETRNSKTFLYLGWVRLADSGDGSATVSYELNQAGVPAGNAPGCSPNLPPTSPDYDPNCAWPTRTLGDRLITFDFKPNGNPPVTIEIRSWNGTAWVDEVSPDPALVQAWVNTATVTDSVLSTGDVSIEARRFGEVALDLTGLGIIPSDSCAGFGAATVKTRQSGSSFESSLEDFIAPLPIVVGNCKLEVDKAVIPADDSGKFDLRINGQVKKEDAQDGDTTGPVPVTTSDPIPVAETAGTGTDLGDYTTTLKCVRRGTNTEFPTSSEDMTGTLRAAFVELTNGDDVVCTFTNTRLGSITIVKDALPDDPQPFTFVPQLQGAVGTTFDLTDDGSGVGNSEIFSDLVPGNYQFLENPVPDEWDLTDLQCKGGANITINLGLRFVIVDLQAGENVTCTFTNTKQATVKALKFHDLNGDGVRDSGEPLLAGWTLWLDLNEDGVKDAGEPERTSTESGPVSFGGLAPDEYQVCELNDKAGWTNSTALCQTVTVQAGETSDPVKFGNFQQGTKSGFKFEDLDADGDISEDTGNPLELWEITAYKDNGAGDGGIAGDGILQAGETDVADSVRTGADGSYSLSLDPGDYVVCEDAYDGWTQSVPSNTKCALLPGAEEVEPGGHSLTMTSGDTTTHVDNNFGNWRPATKAGLKFHDLNANGVKDSGEPGLGGWTFYVDYNDNGTLDSGEPSDVSSSADATLGQYEITGVAPGTWKVREVGQDGWTCSYPNPGTPDSVTGAVTSTDCSYTETFGSGDAKTENNFGNWTTATKAGLKFHDLNANGDMDSREPGLGGWTFYVDYNDNGTLDSGEPSDVSSSADATLGQYEITGVVPGTWKVREVGQDGWTCSYPNPGTPDSVTGAVTSTDCSYTETFGSGDAKTENNFGNWTQGTKSGMKFDDVNGNGDMDSVDSPLEDWVIRAYVDANGDGVLQAGETMIANSDTTDADGSYTLKLDPGTYVVCEVSQAGWMQTKPGGDDECAEISGLEPDGYAIAVTSGWTETDNDFGNFKLGVKGGYKWNDLNGDGVWDQGEPQTNEPPIEGVTIELRSGDTVAASTSTNAEGYYEFTGLTAGDYTVAEVCQANWAQTFPAPTSATAADCGTGVHEITVTSGFNETDNNFGNFVLGVKGGYKWNDLNGDGVWDQGEPQTNEPPIEGVTIELRSGDTVAASTSTNAEGYYEFTGLTAGDYTVAEVCQANWAQTFPTPTSATAADCGTGVHEITVTSGFNETDNNFGNFVLGVKGGYKWNDINGDGTWDEGEPPIEGVTIELRSGDTVAASTSTNAEGYYEFTGLTAGDYTVAEVCQANWAQTFPTPTSATAADCGTGVHEITVTSGFNETDNNFGNFVLGVKGGYKWNDINGDGTWDEGEPPIEGVTIELRSGDTVAASTSTNAEGYYEFTGLTAGDYTVAEVCQANWAQTFPTPTSATAADCGTGVHEITVTSGFNETDNNFGNFVLGVKGGYKWNDINGDGTWDEGEPPIEGVTIELRSGDTVAASTSTNAEGYYEFTGLTAGDYTVAEVCQANWAQTFPTPTSATAADCGTGVHEITVTSGFNETDNNFGNFVLGVKGGYKWNDINGDGTWDEGEPPIEGVTIELRSGDTVAASTSTNAEGYYEFTGLTAGDYTVAEVCQANWAQTFPTPTSATAADCGTGVHEITVTSGFNETDNNFGNFVLGVKGGYKWNDINGDGTWDEGEPPIEGVTIELRSGDTVAASTSTNAEGYYEFTGLTAGDYTVAEVCQANWAQTFPTPTSATAADCGTGVHEITVTSGFNETDNNFGNFVLGVKGGYKWNDISANGFWDGAEPGINGVSIQLWSDNDGSGSVTAADTLVATQVTANGGPLATDGYYAFTGLTAGKYVVAEICQTGWIQSFPTPGAGCGTGVHTITVTSGFAEANNNFGNYQPGVPTLDKTSDPADGELVIPDQQITYFVTVSNIGGSPISGPVVDTLPAYLTVVDGTISDAGVLDLSAGTITWQVTLAPGEVKVLTYNAIVDEDVPDGIDLVNNATFAGLEDSTTHPVENPPVAPIEEEVVAGEELADTGASNVGNIVTAALLAILAGGLMVTFGRRRRETE